MQYSPQRRRMNLSGPAFGRIAQGAGTVYDAQRRRMLAGSAGAPVEIPSTDALYMASALSGVMLTDQGTGGLDASISGLWHYVAAADSVLTCQQLTGAASVTNSGTAAVYISGSTLVFGAGTVYDVQVFDSGAGLLHRFIFCEGTGKSIGNVSADNPGIMTGAGTWAQGNENAYILSSPYATLGRCLPSGNNSSFAALANWVDTKVTDTYGIDSGDAGHSSVCQIVTNNDTADTYFRLINTSPSLYEPMIAGQKYIMSFDYKDVTGNSGYYIENPSDIDYTHAQSTQADKYLDGAGWQSVALVFTFTAGQMACFLRSAHRTIGDTLYLDNFQIRALDQIAPELGETGLSTWGTATEHSAQAWAGLSLYIDFPAGLGIMDKTSRTYWGPLIELSAYYDAGTPRRWHISELRQAFFDSYQHRDQTRHLYASRTADDSLEKLYYFDTALTPAQDAAAITAYNISVTRYKTVMIHGDSMATGYGLGNDYTGFQAKYQGEPIAGVKTWEGDSHEGTGAQTGAAYAIVDLDTAPYVTNPSNRYNSFASFEIVAAYELRALVSEDILFISMACAGASMADYARVTPLLTGVTWAKGGSIAGVQLYTAWLANMHDAITWGLDHDTSIIPLCIINTIQYNDRNIEYTTIPTDPGDLIPDYAAMSDYFEANIAAYLANVTADLGAPDIPVLWLTWYENLPADALLSAGAGYIAALAAANLNVHHFDYFDVLSDTGVPAQGGHPDYAHHELIGAELAAWIKANIW